MFFCHIPSAASEPGTTTFCVRFNSPSTMLKSYSFNPLWAMIYNNFFRKHQTCTTFRANNCTTFAKTLIPGCSLRISFIDPFRFAKKTLQHFARFWRLKLVRGLERGVPNMVLRKNEYLRASNACYTFQLLMSFCK